MTKLLFRRLISILKELQLFSLTFNESSLNCILKDCIGEGGVVIIHLTRILSVGNFSLLQEMITMLMYVWRMNRTRKSFMYLPLTF